MALVCLTIGKLSYYSVEWGIKKFVPPVIAAALEEKRAGYAVPARESKRAKAER